MSTAPATLLEVAQAAAHAAARPLRHMRGEPLAVDTKQSASDLVTAADREAEAAIGALLADRRPEDGVLAEESGARAGASGLTWVVDPLDGTTNFVRGIAYWATSVAVRRDEDGAVLAGAVYAPELDRMYFAARGQGAWLRRAGDGPVALRRDVPPAVGRALLGTGFSYDKAKRGGQARQLVALLEHFADARRLGAASLDLCAVADGGLDAFAESDLEPYDYAAGALIAAEAGARVSGPRPSTRPDGDLVLAAHPDLHAGLLAACAAPA
jgi:myo-inositol-1(or 4)-monophosphatase